MDLDLGNPAVSILELLVAARLLPGQHDIGVANAHLLVLATFPRCPILPEPLHQTGHTTSPSLARRARLKPAHDSGAFDSYTRIAAKRFLPLACTAGSNVKHKDFTLPRRDDFLELLVFVVF